MSDQPLDSEFTWADLERWTRQGLIQPDQLAAIRAHLSGAENSPAIQGLVAPAAATPPQWERPAGLNLVTIAYYFGAFLILLAGTFFVGLQWETLGRPGQFAASWGAVIILWLLGGALCRRGFQLGGHLLIFSGTGIVPLAVYTVLRILDLWPDARDASTYQAFYRTIDASWLMLEIASILLTLVVIWRVRFPLLTLLLAFWGWYLSMDITELVTGHRDFAWGTAEWAVGAAVGLAMVCLGVWLQRRYGSQEWSRWFYLFGHVALLGNLGALALDEGPWHGVLFLAVYVGCVIISVWLQSRIFLAFGALGIYAYVCKLAFDVFAGSLGFTFSLALMGLAIVLLTVAYQRYGSPWLQRRLGASGELASA
jgi:hypothetical protein